MAHSRPCESLNRRLFTSGITRPPAYGVDANELDVDIREDHAPVRAKLEVRRNSGSRPLVLNGDEFGALVGVVERTPARVRADCGNADVRQMTASDAKRAFRV